MTDYLERGARIVINEWLEIKGRDRLLIVTSEKHISEAAALKKFALKKMHLLT